MLEHSLARNEVQTRSRISLKTNLSLIPALDSRRVAEHILERQRTQLAEETRDALRGDALQKRISTTLSHVSAAESMARRVSDRQPSRRESSANLHLAGDSPRGEDMDMCLSDDVDHALLPRRASIMLMLEEQERIRRLIPRQKTRMEVLADEMSQSMGGGALSTQVTGLN